MSFHRTHGCVRAKLPVSSVSVSTTVHAPPSRFSTSTVWPGFGGDATTVRSTHDPASFDPTTSDASTNARTRTGASSDVAWTHPPTSGNWTWYWPVCSCDWTNANLPSAAVVPSATVANPPESAGRHCSRIARPDAHVGSPVTAPDTVTSSRKSTLDAD